MRYRLGSFLLDTERFALFQGERQVGIGPRIFDFVEYLVRHRERMVSKQELVDQVWAGRVVTDDALKRALTEARRVLGDDGRNQRIIKTMYGRGVRFVGDVVQLGDDAQDSPAFRMAPNSIAVLPFLDLGGDLDSRIFADGLAEELITRLSRIPGLQVASRTSSFRFRDPKSDIREIAMALRVGLIVEGSVRKSGSRLRVSIQIIDAIDDVHLNAQTYELQLGDIFQIQDEITHLVASELQGVVLSESYRPSETPTGNVEAYTEFLSGICHWNTMAPDGVALGHRSFVRACEIDPRFATAHAWVGASLAYMAIYGWRRPLDLMRQARAAALRAVDLAPDQPAGHYVLALLESHFFWNWNQADTFFRRATDLNPSDVITHAWYAIFLGRWPELYEQAIERVREALGKDPVCFEANLFKAHIEGLGGRTDRAIDGYRRTCELYPNIALPHIYLCLVLAALDEGEEALKSARRAHALTPADPVVAATIATGLASAGDRDAARAHLQTLLERRDLSYVQPSFVAFAWIGLDEFDLAFDWLERAYRERDSMLTYLPATPYAEKLRRDLRFDSLIGRIGLRPPAAFAVAARVQ